jgi:hypothetical protein
VSLATVFGAASSSCSFAALAAARALVLKGAHFMAAVAFMLASTNLVIEPGILITAEMYVSIVITALAMHYLFVAIGITPDSSRRVQDVAQFPLDYTFYMNVVFVSLAAGLVWIHKWHCREAQTGMDHEMHEGIGPKRIIALLFIALLPVGLGAFLLKGL